jgi:ribosomal protein L7/L12
MTSDSDEPDPLNPKNTNLLGAVGTGGVSLLLGKVEPYVCANCGGRVFRARGQVASPLAAAAPVQAMRMEETPSFGVFLAEVGAMKAAVTEALERSTGMDLRTSAELVDRAPGVVSGGLTEAAAESLKNELERAGAVALVEGLVEWSPPVTKPLEAIEDDDASSPEPDAASLASEIERLAALHERGVLTSEEFAAAKGRLLER